MPNYHYLDQQYAIEQIPQEDYSEVVINGETYQAIANHLYGSEYLIRQADKLSPVSIVQDKDKIWVGFQGQTYVFKALAKTQAANLESASSNTVEAPMTGKILKVMAEAGQAVEKNQPLAVLEAMKMEMTLAAPLTGTIAKVLCTEGQQVELGQLLIELESA